MQRPYTPLLPYSEIDKVFEKWYYSSLLLGYKPQLIT